MAPRRPFALDPAFLDAATQAIALGARLRLARRRADLTQSAASDALAAAFGSRPPGQAFVAKCERGRRRITLDELRAFASCYQVTLPWCYAGLARTAAQAYCEPDWEQAWPWRTLPRAARVALKALSQPGGGRSARDPAMEPISNAPVDVVRPRQRRGRLTPGVVVRGEPRGRPLTDPIRRGQLSAALRASASPPALRIARHPLNLPGPPDSPDDIAVYGFRAMDVDLLEMWNDEGETPLFEAIRLGRYAAADCLLDLGADPFARQGFSVARSWGWRRVEERRGVGHGAPAAPSRTPAVTPWELAVSTAIRPDGFLVALDLLWLIERMLPTPSFVTCISPALRITDARRVVRAGVRTVRNLAAIAPWRYDYLLDDAKRLRSTLEAVHRNMRSSAIAAASVPVRSTTANA